ncbi:MAG: gephyrin-like molybdotransferase Glp [Rhizobiaceae bacterium]
MALLPVDDALAKLLVDAAPLEAETVGIGEAAGRILAAPVTALRTQPPFDASAMDGYAIRAQDVAALPATLSVIGESAAGRRFNGMVGAGEAARIFTGAPVPDGADSILLQENVRVLGAGRIEAFDGTQAGRHIRRAGVDFREGERLLEAGRMLDPVALSLAAAANHPTLPLVRRPLVAVLATGDELLLPGSRPNADQIIASNTFGVTAIVRDAGGTVLDLGIAPDDRGKIAGAVHHALAAGADILVTIGGASVGDHDLVRGVLEGEGMELAFWKIAMRPGKPLMFGRLEKLRVLGLPGNPVSSIVCSHLFLRPLVSRLAGRALVDPLRDARLGADMAGNDVRQDYVRASLEQTADGLVATPFSVQDSAMLKTFATAGALIVRPPFAPAALAGDRCRVLPLR